MKNLENHRKNKKIDGCSSVTTIFFRNTSKGPAWNCKETACRLDEWDRVRCNVFRTISVTSGERTKHSEPTHLLTELPLTLNPSTLTATQNSELCHTHSLSLLVPTRSILVIPPLLFLSRNSHCNSELKTLSHTLTVTSGSISISSRDSAAAISLT
jgi:hypothetical protein